MNTENEFRAVDDMKLSPENNDSLLSQNASDRELPKRKASEDVDSSSPKRIRHDDYFREATSERPRRGSSQERRSSFGGSKGVDVDRRKVATQEEKKRGKRLFGGLLSTLSQTSGGSTQKRRLEIERRQQERMRKQSVEDDKLRAEKRARATEARKDDQIAFDEQVMRNKHTKMLAVAQYLRTKSQPQIYYLPWKLTEAQEDVIDEQTRHAKATIEREVEAFSERKERQANSGRRSSVRTETTAPSNEESVHGSKTTNGTEHPGKTQKTGHEADHHGHHHDEAVDVLEEADEDMVIY
ncbi:hypothetical protein FLAG1_04796 [Fusarium langsethiae]|uniref:Pinin/SDK/MemA protein domain-containing protein n=1 Tax=Fusarium langsethiae TaxID=179993 RepID=A0A0M9EYU2_FUSLA|nr:hypothetical protein FLAG1_04796 [Fusarium langsethiae]GKU02739.1 unnamed protein product [Fusarium langsethiae]GKU20340.1 unnamed protein product [Fusarium langsethiae]